MAGSKRGERRGGAKPGHTRKTPKKQTYRKAVTRAKFLTTRDPEVKHILHSHRTAAEKEQELERYFLVVGRRMRLPKEVMLDVMRYFEETAIDYLEVGRANEQAALDADSTTAKQVYNEAAARAENMGREYLLATLDAAYKAASYVHPRLAAMLSNPRDADQNNTIAVLLRDLDEAGRPPRYIDHDPSEVVK